MGKVLKVFLIAINGIILGADSRMPLMRIQVNEQYIIEKVEAKVERIDIKINERYEIEDYYEIVGMREMKLEDNQRRCDYIVENKKVARIIKSKYIKGISVGTTLVKVVSKINDSMYCLIPIYVVE